MTSHISDPMEREKLLYKLTERSIGTKLLIQEDKGQELLTIIPCAPR